MVWDQLERIEGEAQWKWWAWWACQSRTKLQFEQIHSAIQTISFWIKLDKYILKMRQIGKCWRKGTMKVMGLVLLPTDFTQNSAFWEGSCCKKKRRLLLWLRHRLWLKIFLLPRSKTSKWWNLSFLNFYDFPTEDFFCQYLAQPRFHNFVCWSHNVLNRLAKARKTRKPPDTLGLKMFGPGKLYRSKKIFCLVLYL